MVHEKVVSILYCMTNDHVVDIFMKFLSEAKFVKFMSLLELKVATIIGGCTYVTSPPKYLAHCDDGGGVGTYGYVGSTQLWIF